MTAHGSDGADGAVPGGLGDEDDERGSAPAPATSDAAASADRDAEPVEAAHHQDATAHDAEPAPGEPEPDRQWCKRCGRPLKLEAQFCGGCGQGRAAELDHGAPPVADPALPPVGDRGELRMMLTFYVVALLLSAVWMIYFRITENAFVTETGATATFTLLTLVFAVQHRELLAQPLRRPGFSPVGYALILGASVPIVLVVAGYVSALDKAFGLHMEDELRAFTGHSALWPLLLVVLLPPLEEELAFRGLIFGGLRRSMTVAEAFVVSSFAFAILHLSVPSLVTHLPLGLYFCWLRYRSQSLWPGVFAHACHNLGVCILEWRG